MQPEKKKKKSKGPSPTARTLQECKRREWMAYVTEKRIPKINILKDAFGFGDVLCVEPEKPGATLIQATSDNGGNVAKRIYKIQNECHKEARIWIDAGNRIRVWGWRKQELKGKRPKWILRELELIGPELKAEAR